MTVAVAVVGGLVSAAFGLLALATVASWLRHRERGRGLLALAIVLFAVLPGLSQLQRWADLQPAWLLNELEVLAFIGSGYALLRFRASYVALTPRQRRAADAATLACALASVPVALLGHGGPAALVGAAYALITVTWVGFVLESVVRFWLASRSRPPVQRARLRALSYGFGGLAVVLAGESAGTAFLAHPAGALAADLVVLAAAPLLYVSFSPPAWLRREWRASVEDEVRIALDGLLESEAERPALAGWMLATAMRLIGASAGLVRDGDGSLLAFRGVEPEAAATLGEELAPSMPSLTRLDVVGRGTRNALLVPLRTASGPGALVLLGGTFTPAFAADELARLEEYVVTMAAILANAEARRRLEVANAELESASHHKSAFLANMSHELRTPLTAIIGFSELLADDVDGTFDAETRRQFLEQVRTAGHHLLALINDILDLSKIEAGKMDLHPESVEVDSLVSGLVETVQPLLKEKQLRLETELEPGIVIEADRGKLRQMLLNLVSNAIKFTPDGGLITVISERSDGLVAISVTDTGVGIADVDQSRVFEEFQQVDSGAGRRHQGTGLGLALTRRFAELHGGRVELRSAPGLGSTFTLRLPVTRPASEPPAWTDEDRADPDRPVVLVVEDNAQAAELLGRHLERGGFRMVLARTGRDALRLAKEVPAVAITLDILIPDIDGWDVLADLRRDEKTREIPVVVISVVDDPELGRALGASDYLVKPVDPQVLLSKLRRYAQPPEDGVARPVLVIDDEPANHDLLNAMLEPEGFKVLSAGGGAEGIRLARQRRPALVLLDLVMPDVDGFAVVEALRGDPATSDIPILIITSKDLTQGDKDALSGHVAAIFDRNSTARADLVDWLTRTVRVAVA